MTDPNPVLLLSDLLDFAYCPLRYWLRVEAPRIGYGEEAQPRRTGEQLLQNAVQGALFLYHRYQAEKPMLLSEALSLVWTTWLKRWKLEELAPLLSDYSLRRAELLAQFEAGGRYRKPNGERYQRPRWTYRWAKLAGSSGLTALQKKIDAEQPRAGLSAAGAIVDEDYQRSVLGLAEAYAISEEVVTKAALPGVERIRGVNVPLEVELLSRRIRLNANLVVNAGQETLRGRPRSGEPPRSRAKRVYELHLYEEDEPLPFALARDVRILALAHAIPVGEKSSDGKTPRVEAVRVRHMRSGSVQDFHPKVGEGLDVLEALAVSVEHSIRAGAFVPRMVCGWRACGPCEYRSVCFQDAGILTAINPPLLSQVETGQALYQEMRHLVQAEEQPGVETLETFLRFWELHPQLSAQSTQQILQSLKGETGHDR